MKTYYLLTGATSGLGLETARELARKNSSVMLVVGAREPDKAKALRNLVSKEQLLIGKLDTSSIKSVEHFASWAKTQLDGQAMAGLMLNAGVQIVSDTKFSVDGYELTFATNVLGHILLYLNMKEHATARTIVVSTASGTHDPNHQLAKKHGFLGGEFPSAEAVSTGQYGRSKLPDAGLDRYSTSKLCNVMFTYAMAEQHEASGPRFVAYDPGMMPGTELARDRSKVIQFAWKNVLPVAMRSSEGVSSAKKSGKRIHWQSYQIIRFVVLAK